MSNLIQQHQLPDLKGLETESSLELYRSLGLTPVPLKPRSKIPMVRWSDDVWNPTPAELTFWTCRTTINWAVRCGVNLAVLDFDTEKSYINFVTSHQLPTSCPIVKTSRGYHIWLKPREPIRSQIVDTIEIKCIGSYVVAPPSTHSSGLQYYFLIAPGKELPEVDLEELFHLNGRETDYEACCHPAAPETNHRQNSGHGEPATDEQRDEFRFLFSLLGVIPDGNPTWCPWHPDQEGLQGRPPQKSLSVNWQTCSFCCHSLRCGERGGLGRLRSLVYRIEDCANYSMPILQTKNNSYIPIPEVPPLELWAAAPMPTKRCGTAIHLRHRKERERQRIIGVLCGCWDCATCGPHLKKKWLQHLTPLIMDSKLVHFSIVTKNDWSKVYRRIQCASGEYVKIELNDGLLAVFNTSKEGVPLPQSLRSGILSTAIYAATFDHKPISTSRGWSLPKEDGDKSEWERVSQLSISMDEAREVCHQLGLEAKELSSWAASKAGIQEGFDV